MKWSKQQTPRGKKLTETDVRRISKECTTKTAFSKRSRASYLLAKELGILEEVCSHMQTGKTPVIYKHSIKELYNLKGLYFLYDFDEIVYIGKSSRCMHQRVSAHRRDKTFNKVVAYVINNEADRNIAELYLINKHNPKYNKDGITQNPTNILISNLDDIIAKTVELPC